MSLRSDRNAGPLAMIFGGLAALQAISQLGGTALQYLMVSQLPPSPPMLPGGPRMAAHLETVIIPLTTG